MEQMNRLWEYQLVDTEAARYENDLRAGETYKRFVKLHRFLEDQKRTLQRMNDAVDVRQKEIENAKERFSLLQSRYHDGLGKYEQISKDNLKEIRRFRDYFDQLNAHLSQERQELSKLVGELEKEDAQLAAMRKQLAAARKDYDEVKQQLADEREAFRADVETLQAQAQQIAKDIDKDLLQRYEKAKKSYPTPVANVQANRCTGCNMELSAVLLRRLRDGSDIVECENCGRMLRLEE